MKKIIPLLFGLIFLFSGEVLGQIPPAGGPPDDGGAPVPFSGLEILLAGGAIMGVKKIMGMRNKKSSN
jgi:hypothetical protein